MNKSFGELLLEAKPAAAHSLEQAEHRAGPFTALDAMTGLILKRSLAGERITAIAKRNGNDQLDLLGVSEDDRRFVCQTFLLSEQQKRGAWFLPEQCNVHLGYANFPYHYRRYPRFASGAASDERLKVDLRHSPEAVYFWSALEPLFETLFRPIALRTTNALTGDREEQIRTWQEVDSSFANLGISVADSLAVFRFGGGWSKLRTGEQIEAKARLLRSLAGEATAPFTVAFRVLKVQELVRRYYARTQRGSPTMRQVLTKPLQRTLSAYFGGDWLAFLRYIGEQPHPEERIVEALPEAKLFVSVGDRAAAVAEKHRISPREIEKILKGFWPTGQGVSPVQQRVTALKEYWQHFDDIHSRQASGMPSLWGLVEENDDVRLETADQEQLVPAWHSRGCYRKLFPSDLLQKIDTFWGGVCLLGYPGAIVSAISPHALMAQTLGPALRFWHGTALTAWFVAEGPMSRTNMAGLKKYHARDLAELDALGFSINPQLFKDLIGLEANLGEPRPMPGSESRHAAGDATVTMTVMVGSRRGGFEKLRNVITFHRRAWAQRHLDAYLRARWEIEIRATAKEFNRLLAQKGKAPTAKRFSKFALPPTNHWFGGNVTDLYASFGEKSPVQSRGSRFLPSDLQAFMGRVFRAIGGDRERHNAALPHRGNRKRLAELSVWYVQLREALGAVPTLKEFGASKFGQLSAVLADEPEKAWALYSQAIESNLVTGLDLPEDEERARRVRIPSKDSSTTGKRNCWWKFW